MTTYVSIRPTAVGNVEVSVAASRLAEELTATERADNVRLVEGLQAGRHGRREEDEGRRQAPLAVLRANLYAREQLELCIRRLRGGR